MIKRHVYRILGVAYLSVFYLFNPLSAEEKETKKTLFIDTNAPCISTECHAQMGKKKYIHRVGVDPKKCTWCHQIVKEGEHRFDPLSEKTVSLCAQCHDKNSVTPKEVIDVPPKLILDGEGIKWHEPFAEGKCTACHDAHESNFFKHLKARYPQTPYATYASDAYRLCMNSQCHNNFQKTLEIPRTLIETKFRNGNVNLHYKHINKKKGRTCRTCHRHHGSEFDSLMTNEFRFGSRTLTLEFQKSESGGSCVTPCHRIGKYDRYEPIFNAINSSPTPGRDATLEELEKSRERDLRDQDTNNQ